MSYKELKEEPNEREKNSDCVAYSEIVGALIMTAMLCGTLLMTTRMWVGEHETELAYMRGSTP